MSDDEPARKSIEEDARIDALEKRTAFAVEAGADSCSNAAIEREIEEMRRGQAIEEELARAKG